MNRIKQVGAADTIFCKRASFRAVFCSAATIVLTAMLSVSCHADHPLHNEAKVTNSRPVAPTSAINSRDDIVRARHYLMGQFNPAETDLFVKIPEKYADRPGLYLREEALSAFMQMYRAAKQEGVHLVIRSATRNFNYQKSIWERKWNGQKKLSDGTNARHIKDPRARALRILEYSAMPGTSRHHWGTDIDLNAFNNHWFESGKGQKVYQWLTANAARFGFCQPYTANRSDGYKEEKWHWSYLPLSRELTRSVPAALHDRDITGFQGSETAVSIGVVNKYVLSVNPECK